MDYEYVDYEPDPYEDDEDEGLEMKTVKMPDGTKFTVASDWDVPAMSSTELTPIEFNDMKAMYFSSASNISFGLIMKNDAGYDLFLRNNQPCYGELRKYKKRDPEGYTDPLDINGGSDDYLPGDLRYPFPAGRPVAVFSRVNLSYPMSDGVFDFVSGPESPWRSVTSKMTFERPNEYVIDIILNDTNVDPTVLVSFLNNVKTIGGTDRVEKFIEIGFSPKASVYLGQIFITKTQEYVMNDADTYKRTGVRYTIKTLDNPAFQVSSQLGYYLHPNTDLSSFYDGRVKDLTGGTLADRYDYNRKRLADIFDGPDGERHFETVQQIFKGEVKDIENLEARFWNMIYNENAKEIAA